VSRSLPGRSKSASEIPPIGKKKEKKKGGKKKKKKRKTKTKGNETAGPYPQSIEKRTNKTRPDG
jgi:hypothetical protein